MSKDDSKNVFSVDGFDEIILTVVKSDGKYSCRVLINSEKEEM